MRYLITNEVAYLSSYDPEKVTKDLEIIVGIPGVLKIVSEAEGSPFYKRSDTDGVYYVDAWMLKGRVEMCVIKNDGATVTLQPLHAIRSEEGDLVLFPDASGVLPRTAKAEVALASLEKRYNLLVTKYDMLIKKIDKLFEGYNI